jgi:hypothetical protein
MNGYNDKMPVLVQHVLEKGKGLVVDSERFAVIKEEVRKICLRSYLLLMMLYQGETSYGELLPCSVVQDLGLLWTLSHD